MGKVIKLLLDGVVRSVTTNIFTQIGVATALMAAVWGVMNLLGALAPDQQVVFVLLVLALLTFILNQGLAAVQWLLDYARPIRIRHEPGQPPYAEKQTLTPSDADPTVSRQLQNASDHLREQADALFAAVRHRVEIVNTSRNTIRNVRLELTKFHDGDDPMLPALLKVANSGDGSRNLSKKERCRFDVLIVPDASSEQSGPLPAGIANVAVMQVAKNDGHSFRLRTKEKFGFLLTARGDDVNPHELWFWVTPKSDGGFEMKQGEAP